MFGASKAASRRIAFNSVGVLGLFIAAGSASAAVTVDGTLASGLPDFGTPLATQTNYTQFGKSTDASGNSAGGSELDAAYGVIENNTLYLLFTGNFEAGTAANHINIFLADGRTGQSTLSVSPASTLGTATGNNNGSKFSPNFGNGATYVIDSNDYSGTVYTDTYDLVANTNSYQGSATPNSGTSTVLSNGIAVALNNTNVAGQPVVAPPGNSVNAAEAITATTGYEYAIPLSVLGNPTGNIEVLADINGGGDGYLSNQFLPGLAAGTGNLGNNSNVVNFDFSGTPGAFFTVAAVPEPASIGVISLLGVAGLRRKLR